MRHDVIYSIAQQVAHAAKCCNVSQPLIALPGILLQVTDDAAEHLCRQSGDCHARHTRRASCSPLLVHLLLVCELLLVPLCR